MTRGVTTTGYTATASPGSETCTTGGTSCTVTGLTDGTSYSITVLADTTAGDSGASTPVTVVPRGPSIDQQVTVNGTGTVRTRSFSTTTAGETLLAFASSDGPRGKGRQRVAVRGAGLTWTLVNRANAQAGDAEIWQATVPGTVTGARIRSTPAKPGYRQDLTVVALENTGGVGASARASGASGAPALSLTTTQDGSLIFAVGFDWDNDIGRTLPAGWLMLNQRLGSRATDTYWSQYTSTPIAQAGTAVQVGDTAPVTDRWNLAAVEVTGDTG